MADPAQILEVLGASGPLTGSELAERTHTEIRELWTACRRCPDLGWEAVGRRYLRLDRSVAGYARLSPSIRREFQTYTVVGLRSQSDRIAERAGALGRHLREVSTAKAELAGEVVRGALDTLPDAAAVGEQACFILAGDIVYGMAHDVPRPESSTGELVRGSDLDIVVVTDDDLAPGRQQALDRAMFQRKHYLLVHPQYREEVDYLVKNLSKVHEQLGFVTFEHMVACKILHEGQYLHGSRRRFDQIRELLAERGIGRTLDAMQVSAEQHRDLAERTLLDSPRTVPSAEELILFYTREESEEIY
jgi:hypothetical protein